MKCKKCGAEIDPDSKFCTECGAPVEKDSNTVKQENIQTQESSFKQDSPKEKIVKKAKYHYGFSYVRIFRIVWAIFSILTTICLIFGALGGIGAANNLGANINGAASVLSVVISLLIGLLIYWLGMFSIKRFENIAITAKMLTDIRNKLFEDSGKLKK